MNMPPSQNRSNCAFRSGFLRLAKDSTAQSGLKIIMWIWPCPFVNMAFMDQFAEPVKKIFEVFIDGLVKSRHPV
jgi:hypothetical protein